MITQTSERTRADFDVDLCLGHIRYARAVELARSGKYLEAEAVLLPKGLLPDSPRELDLLARIATLQQQFSRAEKLWEAASRKSSGNVEYSECLEVIRHMDPATDFHYKVKEIDVTEVILMCAECVVTLVVIAATVYVFYHR